MARTGDVAEPCQSLVWTSSSNGPLLLLLLPHVSSVLGYLVDQSYKELRVLRVRHNDTGCTFAHKIRVHILSGEIDKASIITSHRA